MGLETEQTVFSCHALEVDHCMSCHEDADAGYYPMCFVTNLWRRWEAEVCCSVSLAIHSVEKVARAEKP